MPISCRHTHVWFRIVDDGCQGGNFGCELGLGVGAVRCADFEEVLHVPRHHPKLAHHTSRSE